MGRMSLTTSEEAQKSGRGKWSTPQRYHLGQQPRHYVRDFEELEIAPTSQRKLGEERQPREH